MPVIANESLTGGIWTARSTTADPPTINQNRRCTQREKFPYESSMPFPTEFRPTQNPQTLGLTNETQRSENEQVKTYVPSK